MCGQPAHEGGSTNSHNKHNDLVMELYEHSFARTIYVQFSSFPPRMERSISWPTERRVILPVDESRIELFTGVFSSVCQLLVCTGCVLVAHDA